MELGVSVDPKPKSNDAILPFIRSLLGSFLPISSAREFSPTNQNLLQNIQNAKPSILDLLDRGSRLPTPPPPTLFFGPHPPPHLSPSVGWCAKPFVRTFLERVGGTLKRQLA